MALRRFFFALLSLTLLVPAMAVSAPTEARDESSPSTSALQRRQFDAQATLATNLPMSITIIATTAGEGQAHAAMSSAITRAAALAGELIGPGGLQEKLNQIGAGKSIALSPDAFAFFKKAKLLAAQTNGWFDIAAPSPRGWFVQRDWRRIHLNPIDRTVSLKSSDMRFDLTRFAEGFLTDIALDALRSHGITNAQVMIGWAQRNIGNDIFTPWTVRIDFGAQGEAKFASRALSYSLPNVATATVTPSGLGRDLIDAHNRKPILNSDVRSVTTIAADAASAVANGIAVYTLGAKNGVKYLISHASVKGIVVAGDGALYASAGLDAATAKRASSEKPRISGDGGSNDLRQKEREESEGL